MDMAGSRFRWRKADFKLRKNVTAASETVQEGFSLWRVEICYKQVGELI